MYNVSEVSTCWVGASDHQSRTVRRRPLVRSCADVARRVQGLAGEGEDAEEDAETLGGSSIFKKFARPFVDRLKGSNDADFPWVLRNLRLTVRTATRNQLPLGITRYGLVAHDACARRADDGSGDWIVPLQSWIFRQNKGRHSLRLAVCQKLIIEMRHGIKHVDAEQQRRYEERGRLVFRNIAFRGGESGKRVEVRLGADVNEGTWVEVPVDTDTQGRLNTEIRVPSADMDRYMTGKRPDECVLLQVRSTRERGPTSARPALSPAQACIRLVEPEGLTVISDVDDTVKVTDVFAGKKAITMNTFFEEFKAVTGMAKLYRSWEDDVDGVSFNFVSNSPPELLEPLRQFLQKEGFPTAPLHLRPLWGMKSKDRKTFKADTIEMLINQSPRRRFVLLGDSSESDAMIYADIMRRHPSQVIKIIIREVHPEKTVDEQVFAGLPASTWQVFRHASEINLPNLDVPSPVVG